MATVTKTIKVTGGDYSTISSWEAATNLNSDTDIWKGVISDNSAYDEVVLINGGGTSTTSHVWLTVDAANRHRGYLNDTGRARLFYTGAASYVFRVQSDYANVEWLNVRVDGDYSHYAMTCHSQNHVRFGYCMVWVNLVHASQNAGTTGYWVGGNGGTQYLDNCLTYNFEWPIYSGSGNNHIVYLDHCTVQIDDECSASSNAGYHIYQTAGNTSYYYTYNSIFLADGPNPWAISVGTAGTTTLNGSHNIYEKSGWVSGNFDTDNTTNWVSAENRWDDVTKTSGSWVIVTDYDTATPANGDMRIVDDDYNVALDAGTNRAGSEPSVYQDFSVDLYGQPRPTTGITIGAFQYQTITASAGSASGTGTAYDATVLTGAPTTVNAEVASGTGTAYNATTTQAVTASAGVASGTGTAQIPAPALVATAATTSATGTAYGTATAVTVGGESAYAIGMAEADGFSDDFEDGTLHADWTRNTSNFTEQFGKVEHTSGGYPLIGRVVSATPPKGHRDNDFRVIGAMYNDGGGTRLLLRSWTGAYDFLYLNIVNNKFTLWYWNGTGQGYTDYFGDFSGSHTFEAVLVGDQVELWVDGIHARSETLTGISLESLGANFDDAGVGGTANPGGFGSGCEDIVAKILHDLDPSASVVATAGVAQGTGTAYDATTTQAVTAAATAATATAYFYGDDFDDGVLGPEWTVTDGSLVESGGRISSTSGVSLGVAEAGTGDGIFAVTVNMASGGEPNSGILLRATADALDFVMVRLNRNGNQFEVYKRVDGTFTLLTTHAHTINADTDYRLEVMASSDRLSIFLDGTHEFDWTLTAAEMTAIAGTHVGVRNYHNTATTTYWDDISVAPLAVVNVTATAGAATATATASAPSPSQTASGASSSGSGSAYGPSAAVTATAGTPASTGQSHGPGGTAAVVAGLGSAAATAPVPSAQLVVDAQTTSATATASDATTTQAVAAAAEVAQGTGTASGLQAIVAAGASPGFALGAVPTTGYTDDFEDGTKHADWVDSATVNFTEGSGRMTHTASQWGSITRQASATTQDSTIAVLIGITSAQRSRIYIRFDDGSNVLFTELRADTSTLMLRYWDGTTTQEIASWSLDLAGEKLYEITALDTWISISVDGAHVGTATLTGTSLDSLDGVHDAQGLGASSIAQGTGAYAEEITVTALEQPTPSASVTATAEAATASGTSYGTTPSLTAEAALAAAAFVGADAAAAVTATAGIAQASGTAYDATTTQAVTASAEVAQGTGTAAGPSTSVVATASQAAATATASTPTAGLTAPVGSAAATGTASDPVAHQAITVTAGVASATSTVQDLEASVATGATTASATGTASVVSAAAVVVAGAGAAFARVPGIVLATDDFDRANSTTLGNEQGPNTLAWVEQGGDWEIESNQLTQVTAGAGDYAVVDTGLSNVNVSVDVVPDGLTATSLRGLVIRSDGTTSLVVGITGENHADNRLFLRRYTGGSLDSSIAVSSNVDRTATATLRAVVTADDCYVFWNDTLQISFEGLGADAVSAGTKQGVFSVVTAGVSAFNNFVVESLTNAVTVTPAAATTSGTATAADATAIGNSSTTVNAEVAQGTGTASGASPAVTALAAAATATGTAADPGVSTTDIAPAEVASATATASDVTATLAVTSGVASATATASGTAVAMTSVAALATTATGTASAPAAAVTASAATSSAAASASDATATTTVNAEVAQGTGAASDATTAVTITATAEVAQGTGTASPVSPALKATPAAASATATSPAATAVPAITAPGGVGSGAGTAAAPAAALAVNTSTPTATGTAPAPTAVAGSIALPSAATATGTAFGATTAQAVTAAAGLASATGTSHQATDIAGEIEVAGVANVSASGHDATTSVTTGGPELASASASALDATATLVAGVGAASGTGTAGDATTDQSVSASAEAATATGTASGVTPSLAAAASAAVGTTAASAPSAALVATIGAASATGTAYQAIDIAGEIEVPGVGSGSGTAYGAQAAVVATAGLATATGTGTDAIASQTIVASAEAATATGTASDTGTAAVVGAGVATGLGLTAGSELATDTFTRADGTPGNEEGPQGLLWLDESDPARASIATNKLRSDTVNTYILTVDVGYSGALEISATFEAASTEDRWLGLLLRGLTADPEVDSFSVWLDPRWGNTHVYRYISSSGVDLTPVFAGSHTPETTGPWTLRVVDDGSSTLSVYLDDVLLGTKAATEHLDGDHTRVGFRVWSAQNSLADDFSVRLLPASASLAVPAGLASGTGTAHDATVTVGSGAGAATATATAQTPAPSLVAPVGVASATGTASDPTASPGEIEVPGVATATGTAAMVTAAVVATAEATSGTGTAHDGVAAVAITAAAGVASATGTAGNSGTSAVTGAGASAATATAQIATAIPGDRAGAEAAAATGAASPTTAAVVATAATAQGSATASDVVGVPGVFASAELAQATATAPAATPSLGAAAEVAAATGSASAPTSIPGEIETPATATATGSASDATTSQAVAALAEVASATGVAYEATDIAGEIEVAGVGSALALGHDATVATVATVGIAAAAATAPDATSVPGEIETPGIATATATAPAAAPSLGAASGAATATGSGHGASAPAVASAITATAVASGHGPLAAVAGSAQVASGAGSASAASATQAIVAVAEVAAATGTAHQATDIAGEIEVAGVANASATLADPSVAVTATIGSAAATGTASDPSVIIGGIANAEVATATATAGDGLAIPSKLVSAELAAAVGSVGAPAPSVLGTIEIATSVGSAFVVAYAPGLREGIEDLLKMLMQDTVTLSTVTVDEFGDETAADSVTLTKTRCQNRKTRIYTEQGESISVDGVLYVDSVDLDAAQVPLGSWITLPDDTQKQVQAVRLVRTEFGQHHWKIWYG